MPHVEIKYSADIECNICLLFDQIELIINELDPSAGVCKSRAYPAESYKHRHMIIDIYLFPRQHRNHVFTQTLLKRVNDFVKEKIADHSFVSVQLYYRDANYVTIE